MALQIRDIPPNRVADVDAYWPAIMAWYDENWRCSADPNVTLPDPEWVKAGAATLQVSVAWETGRNGGPLGLVIARADGRILWLLALPARFAEVAELLCRHVYSVTGLVPWGVVENGTPLQAFLAGGFAELWDGKPQYASGTVIRLTGV